jgi:protein ImuA
MLPSRAASLAELRQRMAGRGLLVSPEVRVAQPTGFAALDTAVGGWPAPGLAEVVGPPGAGRLGLLRPLLARCGRLGQHVALVDVLERFHPPGLPDLCWERLLIVRPGAERAGWAAEQLAACGDVTVVVVLDPLPAGPAGYRLLRAAEQGGGLVVVVAERSEQGLPASLRLAACGVRPGGMVVQVLRAPGPRAPGRRLELAI